MGRMMALDDARTPVGGESLGCPLMVQPREVLLLRPERVPEASPSRIGARAPNPMVGRDPRYDHSWAPSRPAPGLYWIPKGRLTLDICYLAKF